MTDSKSQDMSRSYRLDVSVHLDPLSSQDDVCQLFKDILRAADARIKISGLENCAFSYNLPDDGVAKISGYMHVNYYYGEFSVTSNRNWSQHLDIR